MEVVSLRSRRVCRAVPAIVALLVTACAARTVGAPAGTSATSTSPTPQASVSAPRTSPGITADPPQFLCQAAQQPRDTADVYTGALSSGQLAQATACVYPGTVPEATSRALLVTGTKGSAYTLNESASGTSVFVYEGRRGRVTVTTTAEPDGHNWVTGVRQG